jgi:hypothetical protein
MKQIMLILVLFSLFACSQRDRETQAMRDRIDSLELKLTESYVPGFGEFMGYVQVHHAKLWYAGRNANWELAGFELDEIREAMDNVRKYEKDRPETRLIGMIDPALDKMQDAIDRRDVELFKSSYSLLTNTCNSCHTAANYGFNVVKVPDTPPFSNQDFSKPGK